MNNASALFAIAALVVSSAGLTTDVRAGVIGTSTGRFSNNSKGTLSGGNDQNFIFGGDAGLDLPDSRLTINSAGTGIYNINGDFDTPIMVGQIEWENNRNPVDFSFDWTTVDANWTFQIADPVFGGGSIVDMTIYLAGSFGGFDVAVTQTLFLGSMLGASGSISDADGTLTATIVGAEMGNGEGILGTFWGSQTWIVEDGTTSQLNLLAEFSYEPTVANAPGPTVAHAPEPTSLAIGLGMLGVVAFPRRRRRS